MIVRRCCFLSFRFFSFIQQLHPSHFDTNRKFKTETTTKNDYDDANSNYIYTLLANRQMFAHPVAFY